MVHVCVRSIVVVTALVLANAWPLYRLHGQELSPSLTPLQYTAVFHVAPTPAAPRLELGDTVRQYASTYWLEGGLILGIPTAFLGLAAAVGFCNDPDSGGGTKSCLGAALLGAGVGAAVGFSLGSLIGGSLKKSERKDQETIREESP